jgi:hypothetical protein
MTMNLISKSIVFPRWIQILTCHTSLTILCLGQMVIQLKLNVMCGYFTCSCYFQMPHLILLCMDPLCISSCIILRIASLVLIVLFTFLVCAIWFFSSRHRHRAVREGVPLHHPWRSRSCFLFRSDRRAHLLHIFYSFTLVVLLLSICCDSVVSHVLFHLLPIWAVLNIRYLSPLFVGWALRVVEHVYGSFVIFISVGFV